MELAELYTQVEVRNAVGIAAAYLDKIKPGWWANVDPLLLKLDDESRCVCGQNGLNWDHVKDEVYLQLDTPLPVFSDRALEPLWLEEIAQRMRRRYVGRGSVARLLADIVADMEDIAATGQDQEGDHATADDLLVEAIEVLSAQSGDVAETRRLASAYARIPKWFA